MIINDLIDFCIYILTMYYFNAELKAEVEASSICDDSFFLYLTCPLLCK